MPINEDRSAAKFFHQVAAWVPDMFCKFCSIKSHKIANKSATIEARENMHRFEIPRILEIF
jgi:hypothetical protein